MIKYVIFQVTEDESDIITTDGLNEDIILYKHFLLEEHGVTIEENDEFIVQNLEQKSRLVITKEEYDTFTEENKRDLLEALMA